MRLLLVDDEAYDMDWLDDLVRAGGHTLDTATNMADGRRRLREHKEGHVHYDLAIIDVMMAVAALDELDDWSDETVDASLRAGLDLMRFAREELKLSREELPILCLTARTDVEEQVTRLGAEYIARDGAESAADIIRAALDDLHRR